MLSVAKWILAAAATGAGTINPRDVPHGGLKIVGDTPLNLLTGHIVDKGKPLYDAAPKK